MQLSSSSSPMRGGDDNLIPLINVVFLMLVFFMVAGQILPADAFNVEPPASRVEKPAPRDAIVILVGRDGRLALGNEELTQASLSVRLETLLGQPASALPLIALKVDAALPARELNDVFDALRRADARAVTLFTVEAGTDGISAP